MSAKAPTPPPAESPAEWWAKNRPGEPRPTSPAPPKGGRDGKCAYESFRRDVIGHREDGETVIQLSQPDDEGWYWYRKDDQHYWSMLQVWQENGHRLCSPQRMRPDTHNHIENFVGEWYGPLTPPTKDIAR